jgi:alpha-glucosidase
MAGTKLTEKFTENTQYGLKNKLKPIELKKIDTNLFRYQLEHQNGKKVYLFILGLGDKTLRFHYSFKSTFQLNINSHLDFGGFAFNNFEYLRQEKDFLLTKNLKIEFNLEPFGIRVTDDNGTLISQDEPGLGFWSSALEYKTQNSQLAEIRCYKKYQELTAPPIIYGLGDKTGDINRWGRRFRNAPLDALGYDGEFTDPLYKDIPFFIHLEPSTQKAHGIFFDNFNSKFFDFGKERKPSPYYYFGAEAGELNYYFFYGPDVKSITSEYLNLTGKPPELPDFCFGYLSSGMSYTENDSDQTQSASEKLLDLFKRFQANQVPSSAFHLSSGYIQDSNGLRQQFIWNHEKFPKPLEFAHSARELGVNLCANLKPVLLLSHPWYQEAKQKKLFIQKTDGDDSISIWDWFRGTPSDEPLVVDYWGGQGSYLNFKSPATQAWWKEKIKTHLLANGIYGIWNDNNEYEIFEPHSCQGHEAEMALIMSKLAYQASLEAHPERAPWILSRSGYSGIQKYSASWVGDNYTSWKSLQYDNAILASCGLSGLIHMGVDIGGFYGPNPDPELFLRWIQTGVFSPRFCIHSYKPTPNEPDMYKESHPEIFQLIQKFLKLRQELIPYIKDASQKASESGIPIMRPTVYDFQDEPETYNQSFEYMFGDKYFVAPIYQSLQTQSIRRFYLPGRNKKWQDIFSGEIYQGGEYIETKVYLEKIPVYQALDLT